MNPSEQKKGFGTAPVFFTAISTILGAILFLRFGWAVGTLGFLGVVLIIILGHVVTIPTAFAISEIATNQRVKGGGEYFIISRSFGLNIGATIGIALYLSQAISVAFYVIAFTEAFESFFNWSEGYYGKMLPRQVISIPAMAILSVLIIKKGANMGVKVLYFVVGILAISLVLFFLGRPVLDTPEAPSLFKDSFRNMDNFFVVFAVCFPAFTGMTAGVGLSGDLRNPSRSIPMGTIMGTFIGMVIYFFIIWKLSVSATPDQLINDQLAMRNIALGGFLIIPLGLAASTISSALGSVMVAPRTLQALGRDSSFPSGRLNRFVTEGKGENAEPVNASVITCAIAFIFVAVGDVNAVAEIISMFFMVTYGALCLISFLNHFGASPSYRPVFKSRWFISLAGFLACVWLMFKINTLYAFAASSIMLLMYLFISGYHKERNGLEVIFRNALFQLNRWIHVYLQKTIKTNNEQEWRPAVVCISESTFERNNAFNLLKWISQKHGFGTYIHKIDGYYSSQTQKEAHEIKARLLEKTESQHSHLYIDTLISPSYTSAVAQLIQLPGISGMENNMIIFEYDKEKPKETVHIIENIGLVQAGNFDIGILASSDKKPDFKNGIHIWVRSSHSETANLMVLLSYIIFEHPEWKKSRIKIFHVSSPEKVEESKDYLQKLIYEGRLSITAKNVEFIVEDENVPFKEMVTNNSSDAGLTMVGFNAEHVKHEGENFFANWGNTGDILFVSTEHEKVIRTE